MADEIDPGTPQRLGERMGPLRKGGGVAEEASPTSWERFGQFAVSVTSTALSALSAGQPIFGLAEKMAELENTRQLAEDAAQGRKHEIEMVRLLDEAAARQHRRGLKMTKLTYRLAMKARAVGFGLTVVQTLAEGGVQEILAVREDKRFLRRVERLDELRNKDHELALELVSHQADVTAEIHTRVEAGRRDSASSPFQLPDEQARRELAACTADGRRPAVLLAPFFDEEGAVAAATGREAVASPQFQVGIRQSLLRSEWLDDLAMAGGYVCRSLDRSDRDLSVIGRVVGDLPVILVYGDVQASRRVFVSVAAWNLTGEQAGGEVRLNFPPFDLPSGDADARLAFEDGLGRLCAMVIGSMADWFHLVRFGRPPRMHLVPEQGEGERRMLALNAAMAYSAALDLGTVDVATALVGQATVLSGVGEHEQACECARAALDALDPLADPVPPERVEQAKALVGVAERAGDSSLRRDAEERLKLLRRAAWGWPGVPG